MFMEDSWEDHAGPMIDTKSNFRVIDCQKCCFKHVIPIPNLDDLKNQYENKFIDERPNIKQKLLDEFPWWQILYNEKFDYFESILNSHSKSILDVGCGLGYFLKVGMDRGWSVTGIDLSNQSVNFVKEHGIDAIQGDFIETDFENQKFDVVNMHEVLEHLADPISVIKKAKRILKPNGLVCILSPNDYNPLQNILRQKGFSPWWVEPPIHINYFNFDSIEKLLKDLGFEILFKTSTFPMEIFLLMGDNYVQDKDLGSKIHKKRVNFETNLYETKNEELRKNLYKCFSDLKIGREFIIIARLSKNNSGEICKNV
jgi:2-polyprenyl-3-methyl-5-hydroxy-6-metoxy-1,4-benzoquinol methylase